MTDISLKGIITEMVDDPEFAKVYDSKVNAFNTLSNMLREAGIDIEYLHSLVKTTEELTRFKTRYYLQKTTATL